MAPASGKAVYTFNVRKMQESVQNGRGDGMRFKTRFVLAIVLTIMAAASAMAQVENAAARANRPL
ncbi:MAG: hypothetical protein A3H94_07705 [Acidobacteria bacterium RIFCSPLOWO2_02_FULL_60_20]|nr:MAG: hypothetical protein A3H94_07705 [Acidobacteria bacterium RIFCSPLOWO2_02_FULL_60_20]